MMSKGSSVMLGMGEKRSSMLEMPATCARRRGSLLGRIL